MPEVLTNLVVIGMTEIQNIKPSAPTLTSQATLFKGGLSLYPSHFGRCQPKVAAVIIICPVQHKKVAMITTKMNLNISSIIWFIYS